MTQRLLFEAPGPAREEAGRALLDLLRTDADLSDRGLRTSRETDDDVAPDHRA